ncbi:MAG: hypothetical protein AB7E52_05410 [Bdellovibrionales bacterium]
MTCCKKSSEKQEERNEDSTKDQTQTPQTPSPAKPKSKAFEEALNAVENMDKKIVH